MNNLNPPVASVGGTWVALTNRSVITIRGADAREFLQGLISSDVEKLAPNRAIYGALLTPQGKFLHEFFLAEQDRWIFLDCEKERREDLLRRLNLYKLRADVDISDSAEEYTVVALLGSHGLGCIEGTARKLGAGVTFVDPRLSALGARVILPKPEAEEFLKAGDYTKTDFETYDRHRLSLGVPDGSRDLAVDKSVLMECNFDELHGVDFEKGCYVGQEVTTRTKRRGLVKKRLLPVDVSGPLPAPGSPVMLDDKEAGTMCSGLDDRGLALLKLDKVELAQRSGATLTSDSAELEAVIPSWLGLDEATENPDTELS